MQTFKEIPFQNYIQLKFNNKNLNQINQQEGLLKYKRNAQLLAEIFTFDRKKRQTYKSEDCISQEQIDQMALSINQEEEANRKRIEETKDISKKYEEISSNIKEIKSKDELFNIIDTLKAHSLYDDSHPYFVPDSPYYLSNTDQDFLQVPRPEESMSEDGLTFYQTN